MQVYESRHYPSQNEVNASELANLSLYRAYGTNSLDHGSASIMFRRVKLLNNNIESGQKDSKLQPCLMAAWEKKEPGCTARLTNKLCAALIDAFSTPQNVLLRKIESFIRQANTSTLLQPEYYILPQAADFASQHGRSLFKTQTCEFDGAKSEWGTRKGAAYVGLPCCSKIQGFGGSRFFIRPLLSQ